jgi:glycosyltransferase involved in cell wall biosynthesis
MNITVIIPTYNRSSFLSKSIESVLNQSIKVDEIIVVDDGSTDNTKVLLKELPVKYIYQENLGVSSARNRGIKESKNQWICFLDSDDIWDKDKLKEQIAFHQNNPNILFSYTDERWFYNQKEIKQNPNQIKGQITFVDNIDLCRIGASTVMLNKSVLTKVGLFDELLKACEDYDLWLRILREYEVGYIDKKLIDKIAGHKGQLSFEVKAQDYYRILALQKHLDSEYKEDIIKVIELKKKILLKGAQKYNNQFFIDFCTNLSLRN